MVMNYILIY